MGCPTCGSTRRRRWLRSRPLRRSSPWPVPEGRRTRSVAPPRTRARGQLSCRGWSGRRRSARRARGPRDLRREPVRIGLCSSGIRVLGPPVIESHRQRYARGARPLPGSPQPGQRSNPLDQQLATIAPSSTRDRGDQTRFRGRGGEVTPKLASGAVAERAGDLWASRVPIQSPSSCRGVLPVLTLRRGRRTTPPGPQCRNAPQGRTMRTQCPHTSSERRS